MTTQTYNIRRNHEKHMIYFDAKELVDLCLQHDILQGEAGKWIAIYHEASKTHPKEYPKGWYKDDYEITGHGCGNLCLDQRSCFIVYKLYDYYTKIQRIRFRGISF